MKHNSICALLFFVGLAFVILAPTAQAHCPHGNNPNHPHCTTVARCPCDILDTVTWAGWEGPECVASSNEAGDSLTLRLPQPPFIFSDGPRAQAGDAFGFCAPPKCDLYCAVRNDVGQETIVGDGLLSVGEYQKCLLDIDLLAIQLGISGCALE